MEYFLEQVNQLNVPQLVAMGLMFWYTYSRLNNKIDAIGTKLDGKIEAVDTKLTNQMSKLEDKLSYQIQKLDEKVTDIDRRVCRMEGAFNNKDCCMIKDSSQLKKAE